MGVHPSLKMDKAGVKQRSVLTRIERIKDLMAHGLWAESQSVTALPKTKIMKIKAKKSVKAKDGEAPAEGEAAAAAPAPAAGKPAKAAKA